MVLCGYLNRPSPADVDSGFVTPLAGAGIVDAVDGLVGPSGRHGGERSAVGVTGGRVDGQKRKAFAVAAIDLDLGGVQLAGESVPAPGRPRLRLALPLTGYAGTLTPECVRLAGRTNHGCICRLRALHLQG